MFFRYQDSSAPVFSTSLRTKTSAQDSEERARVGPLARRRSASKDQKQSQSSKAADSAAFNFEDEFGFDQNDEPTIRLPTKMSDASEVPKSVASEQSGAMLAQTIQRENYSDPTVFASVQEIAVLQQKQKSLMDALNASRNKVSPTTKASRSSQKVSSVQGSRSSGNKPAKRRTSKTDFSKETVPKPPAHIGQAIGNQSEHLKSTNVEPARTDDSFFQQFLTAVTTKPDTPASMTSHYSKSAHRTGVSSGVSNFAAIESSTLPPKTSVPTLPTTHHQTVATNLQATYQGQRSQLLNPPAPHFPQNAPAYSHTPRTTAALPPFSSLYTSMTSTAYSTKPSSVSTSSSVKSFTAASTPDKTIVTSSTKPGRNSASAKNAALQQQPNHPYQSTDQDIFSYLNQRSGVSVSHLPTSTSSQAKETVRNAREKVALAMSHAIATSTPEVQALGVHRPSGKADPKVSESRFNSDMFQSMLMQQQQAAYVTHSLSKSSTSVSYTSQSLSSQHLQSRPSTSIVQSRSSAPKTQFPSRSHPVTAMSTTKTVDSVQSKNLPWLPSPDPVSSVEMQPGPKTSVFSTADEMQTSASVLKTTAVAPPAYDTNANFSSRGMYVPPVSDISAYGYPGKDAFTNYISSQMSSNDPAKVQKSLELLRYAQQQQDKFSAQMLQSQFPSTTSSFTPSSNLSPTTNPPVSASTQATASSSKYQQNPRTSQAQSSFATSFNFQQKLATTTASVPTATTLAQASLAQKTTTTPTKTSSDAAFTKVMGSAISAVDFSSKSTVTAPTTSPLKTPSKSFEQTTPSNTAANILKDKTFPGPKKKHILEKYTQQTQQPTAPVSVAKSDVSQKATDSKTEPNRPRRPSFERNSAPHTRFSQPQRTYGKPSSANTSKSNEKTTSSPGESKKQEPKSDNNAKKNEKSGSIFSLFDSLLQEATESAKDSLKSEPVKKKEPNKLNKDSSKEPSKVSSRKSDSAEKKAPEPTRRGTRASTKASTKASAKAAASAKTTSARASAASSKASAVGVKTTVSNAKVSVASAKNSVNSKTTATNAKTLSVGSEKAPVASSKAPVASSKAPVASSKAPVASSKASTSAKTSASAKASVTSTKASTSVKVSTISTRVSSVAKTTESSVAEPSATDASTTISDATDLQSTTANRTPATFPFKRRHFQNQPKSSSSAATNTTSAPPVSSRPTISSETIINSLPKSAPFSASSQALRAVALASAQTTQAVETPTTTSTEKIPKSTVSDVCGPTTGLKLRITAFRSSGGKVIHQSALLGDLENLDYSSEDSDYRRRKRRKKRRKRRKRIADEIAELNKLLIPLQQLKPSKPVTDSSDDDVSAPPDDYISSPQASDVSDVEGGKTEAKKRKITRSAASKNLATNSVNADSDPEKIKSTPKSKKTPTKAVQRYKVKPQTSSQEMATSALSLSRQPGKLPLYLNAGANQTSVSGSSQGIPTIQLVPRSCPKPTIKLSSLSSVSTLHSAIKLPNTSTSAGIKLIQPQIIPKSSSAGVRYLLQTSNSIGSNFSPRVIIPKITPTTFSVGKATVFTVSSSGARVFGTPKIQIQPTPTQTSSQNPAILPATKPLMVKRLPVSLLSKIAISSAPIVKVTESPTTVTSSIQLPRVVSFTSKPVKSSNKILAPKPVLATSLPSALEKSLSEINVPQIVIPTITEALDQNGNSQEKSTDEAEFQV